MSKYLGSLAGIILSVVVTVSVSSSKILPDVQHIQTYTTLRALQPVSFSKPAQAVLIATIAPTVQTSAVASPAASHAQLMDEAGIPTSDQPIAELLVERESGWNAEAVNRSSGACGLAQELPCGKSGCSVGNAVCELEWMNGYVLARYSSWANAWAHEQNFSWY